MHFFTGFASGGELEMKEEDAWSGEKFMQIQDVIALLKNLVLSKKALQNIANYS
jgi:hypothetical protein